MYVSTGDAHWLEVARRPLAFLDATATPAGDGVNWPIMVDAGGEETDPNRATGMEEGAAGIGWVYLQAYAMTGERAPTRPARGRAVADGGGAA